MAKLRITGFLLVFPPSDDNLIKSQMVSGLLQSDHPPAISVIVATGSSDAARVGDFIFVVKANEDNKREYQIIFQFSRGRRVNADINMMIRMTNGH